MTALRIARGAALLIPLVSLLAGTRVMTMAGPLPIEQIEPGMMALSAPECGTGAPAFRPVAGVSRNRVKELVRISYDHDGSAATPDETVTASTGHPFWIEEARAFVPAAEVRPGQHLRLAEEGRSAEVAAVTRQRAPPGPGLSVFNFSVAGHHTYFAGTGGVWVHNAMCPEGLERMATKYKSILGTGTKTKEQALGEVFEAMQRDGGFSEEDFQQTAEFLFSNAVDLEADFLLRSHPSSYRTHSALRAARAASGIDGNALTSHHLLTEKLAHVVGITDTDDIIAVPLTQKWHMGIGGSKVIGEGSNIYAMIRRTLVDMGESPYNPSPDALFRAHKRVYLQLDREDWARAIHTLYFAPLGIPY